MTEPYLQPDPCIIKYVKKIPATMWAILDPKGNILTETVSSKRWKAIYAVTHGYHKFPQNWKKVYYNRGFRATKVTVRL